VKRSEYQSKILRIPRLHLILALTCGGCTGVEENSRIESQNSHQQSESGQVTEKSPAGATREADASAGSAGADHSPPQSTKSDQSELPEKVDPSTSASNTTADQENTTTPPVTQPPTSPVTKLPTTEPKKPAVINNKFYPIAEPRPTKVCGREGFAYLWKGYLVPECGGCHYLNNIYKQSPFGQKDDLEGSFNAMLSEDKAAIMRAIGGQVFCKKCVLKPDDPLQKDIADWLDARSVCPP
jgi:hypothetical protein